MVCEQCKMRPATVHLTKIVNNQKTAMNLCEECAGNYHNFSPFSDNFSIHKLLTSLLGQGQKSQVIDYGDRGNKCPQCGLTLAEFSHSGKLGCNECYATFIEHIRPMLRKIHGSNANQGKVPKRTGRSYQIRRDIENLKNDLQLLIQHEEFEKAAIVRDKIRELEKKLT